MGFLRFGCSGWAIDFKSVSFIQMFGEKTLRRSNSVVVHNVVK